MQRVSTAHVIRHGGVLGSIPRTWPEKWTTFLPLQESTGDAANCYESAAAKQPYTRYLELEEKK